MGASTPDKVIKEVIGRMEELNKQGIETVEAASVVDTPESKESGEKNFFEEARRFPCYSEDRQVVRQDNQL